MLSLRVMLISEYMLIFEIYQSSNYGNLRGYISLSKGMLIPELWRDRVKMERMKMKRMKVVSMICISIVNYIRC